MIILEVVIKKISDGPKAKLAEGVVNLLVGDLLFASWPFKSGGWGLGPLPLGKWKSTTISRLPDTSENVAYKRDSFPWFMALIPKFQTTRSGIGIHGDGNVPGTLGCVGLQTPDAEFYYTMNLLLNRFKLIDVVVRLA